MPLNLTADDMAAELAAFRRTRTSTPKGAKFPAGETMTVDEVAEVVGPKFKEMNENPPESVVKVREQMTGTRVAVEGDEAEGDTEAKFEEGKPADPTVNMSPEDKAEWNKQKELHKDEFKAAADRTANRDWASMFPAKSYLNMFFSEKEIPYKEFKVTDSHGMTHFIPNDVVVEAISQTGSGERKKIEDTIRKIDFANGDVNHFFEHLAKALAEQYSGALRFAAKTYTLSLAPDGAPMVDGYVDPILFGMIIAGALEYPRGAVKADPNNLKAVRVGQSQMTWARALAKIAEEAPNKVTKSGTNTYKARVTVNSIYEQGMVASGAGGRVRLTWDNNLRAASEEEAEKLEQESKADEEEAEAKQDKADAERMKEAAGGLYGFTKQTQHDVEAASKRLAKRALAIAKAAYGGDERVVGFLQTHAKRASSDSARLLLAAMREIGPKVASEEPKTAAAKDSGGIGLYGFPNKTAMLGLNACTELRAYAGEVTAALHTRRAAQYEHLTGFLKEHSKKAKCGYAKMLLASYPDASFGSKVASAPNTVNDWLTWEPS